MSREVPCAAIVRPCSAFCFLRETLRIDGGACNTLFDECEYNLGPKLRWRIVAYQGGMMQRVYKGYSKVIVDGDVTYCVGVEACLDQIDALADGKLLLTALCGTAHHVTIVNSAPAGNSTSTAGAGTGWRPILLEAMAVNSQNQFQTEMLAALNKAQAGGINLEHIARQLEMGLTPVTYKASSNVVRPTTVALSWWERNVKGVKNVVDKRIAAQAENLLGLAAGTLPLSALPNGWKNDLPRVLRNYLTPGPGASPTVKFNPLGTMHCPHNPPMHGRPPAIGLAHELIHALHCMRGVNQRDNRIGGEKLEEIITTGFPPYNYEEFSDNKLRAQWPTNLDLRQKY